MRNLRTSCQARSGPGSILYDCLKGCLVGIILGFSFALLSASWVWLEMRVNVGLMIPIMTLICLSMALWKSGIFRYRLFLCLQILFFIVFFLLYGYDPVALRIVPASLFREGCQATDMSLDMANIILVVILIGGNVVMFRTVRPFLPIGKMWAPRFWAFLHDPFSKNR